MPVGHKKKSHSKLLSNLGSLESGADRRNFLSRHKTLVRSESVKQLADLVVEKIRVDTAEALRLAEAALLIAKKLRRKEDLALAMRAKANALYACGENRAAVEHHESAFRLFEELGERMQAARTLSHSIQPLILLGEYERGFKAGKALEFLQATSPYEFSDAGALYAVYLRGQAKLLLHQGKDAVEDFQRIVDHKGLVGNSNQGALAHLGLARAYALSGDAVKSRTAYQDFFTLWKDADPDIPVLKQAKAEYAKLQ